MSATLYPGESYPGDYYSESDPQNTILVPKISAAGSVFALTLAASGAAPLTVPAISSSTVVRAPALGHANQDINLNFITGSTVLYTIRLRRQPHGISLGFGNAALDDAPDWEQVDA